jgi:phosphoribulokinase
MAAPARRRRTGEGGHRPVVFAAGMGGATDRMHGVKADSEQRPILIGIVGESGAGKSTFAAGLARVLGVERTAVICTDDYLRYSRRERAALHITPHDPAANYMDILEQHVDLLRAGEPILKPVYNHQGGLLEPPEYVVPKPFILLAGPLGLATPRLLAAHDVKIYLEPEETLRRRWKFKRDTEWGGYSPEAARAAIVELKRDSQLFVLPQRGSVDMVVSFYPPADDPDAPDDRLNVRHILRSTLPHLDLAPLLELGPGLQLELARDVDGRPVDALHVFGSIGANGSFHRLCENLWVRIGRPGPLPPGLGEYRVSATAFAISPTLAISQLLVGEYLLNAAEAAAMT